MGCIYTYTGGMKHRVQGFVTGAAVMAGLMLGLPHMTAPLSPSEDWDGIAELFAVQIVWTESNPCMLTGQQVNGCFTASTPSMIYVSPSLDKTSTRELVLHEIGHVMQWRLGMPPSEPGADVFSDWYRWAGVGDFRPDQTTCATSPRSRQTACP